MIVEVQNCAHTVKFTPEVVYPGKYLCLGICHWFEKPTNSDKPTVTIEINGEGDANKANCLNAICKESDCPSQIKI